MSSDGAHIGPAYSEVTAGWVADVERAASANDWPKAITLAGRALALSLVHPRLLHVRAIGREQAGDGAAALNDLIQAHRLDADDPGIANALATALTRAGRAAEARAILDRVVATHPDIPESWFNLGVAAQASADLRAAGAAFARAIALRPDFSQALGKLAILALHRGEVKEGRALAERTLALAPDNADARRALIEAQIESRDATGAETGARLWLAYPRLGPNGAMQAFGLLGDALDLQGRYGEAFAAYGESKAAFAAANAARFRSLDMQPLALLLQGMRREFVKLGAAASPATSVMVDREPDAPKTHVFLMGFMRSGTTLLEQALSRHPDVVTLEETEAMAEAGAAKLGEPGAFAAIAAMGEAEVRSNRAAYWSAVRRAGVEPGGRVLVDKLPFNGIKLPLIRALFPEARIVFALRDPRDVVLSCFQKRLQANSFAYEMRSLGGAARFYAAYMELVAAYRAALGLHILDHRHEALVADLPGSVRQVCDFTGLDFRPEMTDFQRPAQAGAVMSQTSRQLRGGVNAKGLGRWRAYAKEMSGATPILAPWVAAYGYAPE